MDRRNFLKTASIVASGGIVGGVAQAAEPTPTVYSVGFTTYPVLGGGQEVRLDFTAERGGEVIGTATSYGGDVSEAIHVLSDILRPGDPKAADWVLKTEGHLEAPTEE